MKITTIAGTFFGAALSLAATPTLAAMGNAPSTYGVLPHDVATAQALSLFSTQVSSVYYNPAALARDGRGELTGGLFHADHTLRAESLGGAAPAQRSGSVLDDTPSQQLLLGLKTDLSNLTTFRHPLYLGFMLGSERYAQEMLAFNAETSEFGQFLHYGRQPLFLSIGVGTQLWRGINFGAALRLTLHSDAKLYTETNLQGDTRRERLDVTAEPVLRPILGFHVNMGETFCSVQDCWMDHLDIALGYRGYSNTRVRVDAEAEIPGTVTGPGLELAIRAIDSFQPEITTLGIQYAFAGRTRVGLTGEYQAWQRLSREFEGDTVRDQAEARFRDIVIPRLGLEHDVSEHFTVKTGAAWERSALRSTRTPDVNYLDNDKLVLGLGLSVVAHRLPFMAHPVQIDVGYQFHHLKHREFDLVTSDPSDPDPLETVRTKGEVHVFAGSVTLRF
ncbi:OmpP1/FadL family transporter [Isoalcanivorax indicus]|uniref:OmpP1/FadL family transporter n=1 Tax=Isoalcanivorax indicus TaxID=2202653 RepID=UPI000DB9FCC0|nr:aromatic hydrocarbon degradation protein [Isoalcanivorax indicus]